MNNEANKTDNIANHEFAEEAVDSNFRVLMQKSVNSNIGSHEIGNELLIADWKKRQYDKNGFTLPASAQALYLYAENRKSHSRSLFTNMRKANPNLTKDSTKHMHHIVAAKDHRAEVSRQVMFSKGIGINDYCNGAYLNKIGHSQMHTDLYYAWVAQKTDRVKHDDSSTLRAILIELGNQLKTGFNLS